MNKVSIAQIEGRVVGGGSELSAAFDMRFGVHGKTRINQRDKSADSHAGASIHAEKLPALGSTSDSNEF